MDNQVQDNNQEVSSLGMSDEEFMSRPIPDQTMDVTEEVDTSDVPEDVEQEDNVEVDETEETTDTTEVEDSDTEEVEEESTDEEETEQEEESNTTSEIDYEEAYKKLTQPFRANGKEMQVDNVDDALSLMKMGANYSKKMAALKPNLKVMRMLENHDLLDESKLSFLIDLDKKNPEAISKLVKDSGLDPLEMDETSDYQATTYTVDDSQIALEEVLGDIQESPAYDQTIDVISNKWDESSRELVIQNPEVIRVINDHVEKGYYKQITDVIEKERMLGRLNGLTDLQAYKQIGDQLQASNAFDNKPDAPTVKNTVVSTPVKQPKTDPQTKKRKLAASTPRASNNKPVPKEYNALALSDEEFEKLVANKYR